MNCKQIVLNIKGKLSVFAKKKKELTGVTFLKNSLINNKLFNFQKKIEVQLELEE